MYPAWHIYSGNSAKWRRYGDGSGGCSQIQVLPKQFHSAYALDGHFREWEAFASKGIGLAYHLTWKSQALGVSTSSSPQGAFIASILPNPHLSRNLNLLTGIH